MSFEGNGNKNMMVICKKCFDEIVPSNDEINRMIFPVVRGSLACGCCYLVHDDEVFVSYSSHVKLKLLGYIRNKKIKAIIDR